MLAAPARFATEELLKLAVKTVESAGFLPVIPVGITSREGQLLSLRTQRNFVLGKTIFIKAFPSRKSLEIRVIKSETRFSPNCPILI
jgi:hypothetical protein